MMTISATAEDIVVMFLRQDTHLCFQALTEDEMTRIQLKTWMQAARMAELRLSSGVQCVQ